MTVPSSQCGVSSGIGLPVLLGRAISRFDLSGGMFWAETALYAPFFAPVPLRFIKLVKKFCRLSVSIT